MSAGKTSTPRSAGRLQGRRNVGSQQTARQRTVPAADHTRPGSDHTRLASDNTSDNKLHRTNSGQSSASSSSTTGSSKTGPVPKPRSSASINADETDLAPSRRTAREPRRRVAPSVPARQPEPRSQSTPGDRVEPCMTSTTPARNGVVTGRSAHHHHHQQQQQQVDRSLGSVDSPLSAFIDRSGLVFDVRAKTAYRRGRLLGKVCTYQYTTTRCSVDDTVPSWF